LAFHVEGQHGAVEAEKLSGECASVLGDHVSIPGTDLSALYCAPGASCNLHGWTKNLPDRANPDDVSDHVSRPDTEEDSLMFTCRHYDIRPGVPARVPLKHSSRRGSQRLGLESIADEDGQEFFMASEGMELDKQMCQECGREESNGWPDRHDRYWCIQCWDKWGEQRRSKGTDEQTVVNSAPAMWQRYDMMDPIFCVEQYDTEVQVMNMCCLTAACMSRPPPCIVALHPDILPVCAQQPEHKWPISALLERTSFKEACQDLVVPRHGGIYLPDVAIRKDEFGQAIRPLSVPFLIACPSWKPSNDVRSAAQFREEMRTKIRNILRICYQQGHEDLIISATFHALPAREIAALFHELLLVSGDTVGAFRRVTMALPQEEVAARVIFGFREEFKYLEDRDDPCTSWRDGKYLLPSNQQDLCLDAAGVHNAKLHQINGARVKLHEPLVSSAHGEVQQWLHLPCGRIVLAAMPQLCLSAAEQVDGAEVHIWGRVEKNQHLQIWEVTPQGICLAIDPMLQLSTSEYRQVQLHRAEPSSRIVWSWRPQVLGSCSL